MKQIKRYIVVIDGKRILGRDEPLTQKDIIDICYVHGAKFREQHTYQGEFEVYVFDRKHANDENRRTNADAKHGEKK